ncbi:histidine kinase dimerization/phospho-acceptor domain-containing protein [Streptomyces aureus]
MLAPDGRLLAFTDGAGRSPLADVAQTRAATRKDIEFTASVDDQDYRMLAVPATNDDNKVVVVVGASTRVADAATAHTRDALLLGGPPAVLAAGLGAYWLAGSALRPVDRMRRRLAEITEQDTGARLEAPATHDEIATLAATMNDVLDRLAEALAQQRGFAADAGHELRTPLTALKAELELAGQPGRTKEELIAAVAATAQDTDRLIRLSEDLLLLSRTDEGGPSCGRSRWHPPNCSPPPRGQPRRARQPEVCGCACGPTTAYGCWPIRTGCGRPSTTCSTTRCATPPKAATSTSASRSTARRPTHAP